jgi:anti-sigma factor (TIGR02949 family)
MTRATSCSDTVGRLWDYLDNAVASGDREEVETHLLICRTCRGELRFAEGLREVLAFGATEDIPPQVKARLERFVDAL